MSSDDDDASIPLLQPLSHENGSDGSLSYPTLFEYGAMSLQAPVASQPQQPSWLGTTNTECPLCNNPLVPVEAPVNINPCLHGFHIKCGSMFVFGAACPFKACMGKPVDSPAVKAAAAGAASALVGAKQPEFNDPVLQYVYAKRNKAAASSAVAATKPNEIAGVTQRMPEDYAKGYGGLSSVGKIKLLAPYGFHATSNLKAVTLATLTALESKRTEARGDKQELNEWGEAVDRRARLSVDRFLNVGLNLGDIYHGLQVDSWDVLVHGLGLGARHLTSEGGPVPVQMLADLYDVDHKTLVQDLEWNKEDIISAKLTPKDLNRLGLTFRDLVCELDFDREDILKMKGWKASDWAGIGLTKQYLVEPLEIYATDMEKMGWGLHDTARAFDLNPAEQELLGMFEAKRLQMQKRTDRSVAGPTNAGHGGSDSDDSTSSSSDDGGSGGDANTTNSLSTGAAKLAGAFLSFAAPPSRGRGRARGRGRGRGHESRERSRGHKRHRHRSEGGLSSYRTGPAPVLTLDSSDSD